MGKKGRHAQAPDVFPFQLNEAGAGTRDLRPAKKSKMPCRLKPVATAWAKRSFFLFGIKKPCCCPSTVCGDDEGKMARGGSYGEVKDGMHAGPSGGFVLKHTNLLPSGPH